MRARLLDATRPDGLPDVVRRLTLLQIDPAAAVAPSADLVAWSRLGASGYTTAGLTAGPAGRTPPELRAMFRPAEDLALYREETAEWPERGTPTSWREYHGTWVAANDACRRDILDRLGAAGPLPSRELPDTCELPWRSSGWSNHRNVTELLDRGPGALPRTGTRAAPVARAHGSAPAGRCSAGAEVRSRGPVGPPGP